jgi:hypothetical protein
VQPVSHLTSCTATECNLYFDISFATVMRESDLWRPLTFHVPNLISIFVSLGCLSHESAKVQGLTFLNKFIFYGEDLLASRPTPKLQDTDLVDCPRLLIKYIHNYPPYMEAVFSIRNLRTRHAHVTRGTLNMAKTVIREAKFIKNNTNII